ncbi:hypothetical protein Q5P01_000535 [Channa striata]|uniref:Uncharacterized protein n=1 Tax=Channa striata TaxID=64152 RepID=A0AA88IRY4_CHASR|nr:hypothetical protein Q5P01_000535 [Channa striata]
MPHVNAIKEQANFFPKNRLVVGAGTMEHVKNTGSLENTKVVMDLDAGVFAKAKARVTKEKDPRVAQELGRFSIATRDVQRVQRCVCFGPDFRLWSGAHSQRGLRGLITDCGVDVLSDCRLSGTARARHGAPDIRTRPPVSRRRRDARRRTCVRGRAPRDQAQAHHAIAVLTVTLVLAARCVAGALCGGGRLLLIYCESTISVYTFPLGYSVASQGVGHSEAIGLSGFLDRCGRQSEFTVPPESNFTKPSGASKAASSIRGVRGASSSKESQGSKD